MARLGTSSKFNGDWEFLCELRDLGRARTNTWLAENYEAIGKDSTLKVDEVFV